MTTIVLKPFKTARRRFAAGAPVTEADDLAPFTLADLKARNFIGAPPASKNEAAPAKGAKSNAS